MFNLRPIPLGSVPGLEPVFIVGAARSGTTALQLALNMHPELGVYGETQAFFVHRKFGFPANPVNMRRLLEYWRLVIAGCCPHTDLLDNQSIQNGLANAPSYAHVLNLIMGALASREGKQRWGEKTPSHIFRLREIRSCFPNARIIHLVRDPRAVVCSTIKAFNRNEFTEWNIFAATNYWVRCIKAHEKEVESRSDYILVRYEDFVTRPEGALNGICSFLGLRFVSDMLEAHRVASNYVRPGKSGEIPALHALTREPLNPQRSDAWKGILSPAQSKLIEKVAGKQMSKLGYETARKKYSPPQMRVSYFMTRWALNESRRVATKQLKEPFWALRRAFGERSTTHVASEGTSIAHARFQKEPSTSMTTTESKSKKSA